ncbi:hypothetical protein DL766_006763 [Monosporascus sp. MC13-8B]|uniref:F-box domain-containing protein n=1 Tax=Monosporascus cannonballus TaxID=155416 RepID=A0ABY0HHE6_9PEZI|nr:hypothetical protein DL762_002602 [Monosporascus cannonballus]RYP01562.1 hypothetical protein DL763_000093 [Monosporascus cannonballus]RYP26310.1 hypothetical protein DL766_006763 [Monosporascus sp. MC13-8B]
MDDSRKPPITIGDLPPEVMLHVFDFLAGATSSEERLHEQPSATLLDGEPGSRNLKRASLVSRAWRSLTLPLLFRHVLWRPRVTSLSAFTLNPIPLLRFLEENGLVADRHHHHRSGVETLTLVVDFVEDGWGAGDDAHPHAHRQGRTGAGPRIRSVDLEWLWDQLFSVVDPLRFTVMAPPTTLAALLSRTLFLDDAWAFDMPYHILSLSRIRGGEELLSKHQKMEWPLSDYRLSSTGAAAKSDGGEASSSRGEAAGPSRSSTSSRRPSRWKKQAPPSPLFTIRPWTALLLNEGSSTRAYKTSEFFFRRPPSLLGALLGCEEGPHNDGNAPPPLIPQTVRDLSYVAVFPLSSHVEATLAPHLPPHVERLFVRLTPTPKSRLFLEDNGVDPADLWLERNAAYQSLIREFVAAFSPPTPSSLSSPPSPGAGGEVERHNNWANLRVFETGDAAADGKAWDMSCRLLGRSGVRGWKVEREGLLVRYDDGDENLLSVWLIPCLSSSPPASHLQCHGLRMIAQNTSSVRTSSTSMSILGLVAAGEASGRRS